MSIFSKTPINRPKRNLFNLSYQNKFSCNLGQLVPIMCKPVVPGDTFKCSSELFVRTAPLISPMFQQLDVYVHYFYVPNRLICKDWEQYISPHATKDNPQPSELQLPSIDLRDKKTFQFPNTSLFAPGSLMDFLGYHGQTENTSDENALVASILPVNAYNLIYQSYYCDQNLGLASRVDDPFLLDEMKVYGANDGFEEKYEGDTGESLINYFSLRQRCWKKDYFTSALPFTQRGADVHLPLYGNASINSDGTYVEADVSGSILYKSSTGKVNNSNGTVNIHGSSLNSYTLTGLMDNGQSTDALTHTHTGKVDSKEIAKKLSVDLDNVSAATINELRRATRLQQYLETSARVGGRYKEFVLGHFGVNVPDGRLQRPEYLGGGVCKISIGEVTQTSMTVNSGDDVAALGQMAGRGSAYGNSNSFKHSFPEHGYVMAIMSIQPKAAYFQGVCRDLLKQDRLDIYTPEFANLGEQPIMNAELFATGAKPKETFGYTPRYAEYKFSLDEIHGQFRDTLDTWHMARVFGEQPTLSNKFIEVNENEDGLNRVFAVPGTTENPVEHFYVYVQNNIKALRPMPVFGVPTL